MESARSDPRGKAIKAVDSAQPRKNEGWSLLVCSKIAQLSNGRDVRGSHHVKPAFPCSAGENVPSRNGQDRHAQPGLRNWEGEVKQEILQQKAALQFDPISRTVFNDRG